MKVFLTTSGTGSRLNELTKYINKALVRVGKKPAISYIIESYSSDTEFVITLGYKGDQVKDFLELAYPTIHFTFIWVDKYEGPGTSLGYSMLQAKQELQCPFIFHACDTIVEGWKAPEPSENWAAGLSMDDMTQYTSFDVNEDGYISKYNDKGALGADLVHIGLIGVQDYKNYWETLERIYATDPNDSRLNDTITLSDMISRGAKVKAVAVPSWLDIGNPSALINARANISDHFENLDKVDESLFFFGDFAIKFFAQEKKVADRVARGEILKGLVPRTLEVRKNFYKYEFVRGGLYSEVATKDDFKKFLSWSQSYLWKPVQEVSDEKFHTVCRDFYENKTKERVQKFLSMYQLEDIETTINGNIIPPLKDMLNTVDFDWLAQGVQAQFHGDYILENILKTEEGYCLLDWRQDFGGQLRGGDMYYDLGKLAHNLVVNHDIISRNLFAISVEGDMITCDIQRKPHLVECEKVLETFLAEEGFDKKKVQVIRALIWLSMSPLHHDAFNPFLFYFGKLHLWQALQNP